MKPYTLLLLISTSCAKKNAPTNGVTENVFNKIESAQNYEEYVKINSAIEVIQTENMNGQLDTLVLYTAETRFYQDQWKPIEHLRLCFLSDPFRFYQTRKEKGKDMYAIGKVNITFKSIEILKNGEHFKNVSELHSTIIE